MGANVGYRVRVLVTQEAVIEVSALTRGHALEEAAKEPGVIMALRIESEFGDEEDDE